VAYYAATWFQERWGKSIAMALPIIHELMSAENPDMDLE
jgi:hypothetical protein